jgi:hypothetical protein
MFVKDITRYTLNTLKITARSKELQVKPLEVQFNLRDTFGYMPLPKESWSSYIKFSKSGKSGTKDHPQTYKQGTIYEHNRKRVILQDMI